jgi:hypothetical protein
MVLFLTSRRCVSVSFFYLIVAKFQYCDNSRKPLQTGSATECSQDLQFEGWF